MRSSKELIRKVAIPLWLATLLLPTLLVACDNDGNKNDGLINGQPTGLVIPTGEPRPPMFYDPTPPSTPPSTPSSTPRLFDGFIPVSESNFPSKPVVGSTPGLTGNADSEEILTPEAVPVPEPPRK